MNKAGWITVICHLNADYVATLFFFPFLYYRVMGFSSPLHNVKGFSVSRPPVVVFVVCLISFACATLAMAFFIDHAEIVSNPEIKGVSQ